MKLLARYVSSANEADRATPPDYSGVCLFVYGRHNGGVTGRICMRPENEHCPDSFGKCGGLHPHHPFHRRAGKRCECGRPIEIYYSRCRVCYKEKGR